MLGELIAGTVLGNLTLAGFSGVQAIKTDPVIDAVAEFAVLILLFEVGLTSTVSQMLKTAGPRSWWRRWAW